MTTKPDRDLLEYAGYCGTVNVSLEDETLYGEVLYIRDLIMYDGIDVPTLTANFKKAVDDYLALCRELGDKPEKPFTGTFQVRIPQDLHRGIAIAAQKANISINKFTEEALAMKVEGRRQVRLDDLIARQHLEFATKLDAVTTNSQVSGATNATGSTQLCSEFRQKVTSMRTA